MIFERRDLEGILQSLEVWKIPLCLELLDKESISPNTAVVHHTHRSVDRSTVPRVSPFPCPSFPLVLSIRNILPGFQGFPFFLCPSRPFINYQRRWLSTNQRSWQLPWSQHQAGLKNHPRKQKAAENQKRLLKRSCQQTLLKNMHPRKKQKGRLQSLLLPPFLLGALRFLSILDLKTDVNTILIFFEKG